jgi:hypothetical protein
MQYDVKNDVAAPVSTVQHNHLQITNGRSGSLIRFGVRSLLYKQQRCMFCVLWLAVWACYPQGGGHAGAGVTTIEPVPGQAAASSTAQKVYYWCH